MERAYIATGEEVLRFFNVDERTGLDSQRVRAALLRYGRNGRKGISLKISSLLDVCSDD